MNDVLQAICNDPGSGGEVTLVLSGNLTIRTAEATRQKLLDAICRHSAIVIDWSAGSDFDLSFLQLILSARKTADAAGKPLRLALPASGALRDKLVQSGLVKADGTQIAEQGIWFE